MLRHAVQPHLEISVLLHPSEHGVFFIFVILVVLIVMKILLRRETDEQLLIKRIVSKYGVPEQLAVRVRVIRPNEVALQRYLLPLVGHRLDAHLVNVCVANQVELYLAHDDLVGQRILHGQREIHVVPRPQDVLFIVFVVELVVVIQNPLQKVYIRLHQELNEVRSVEVVVELLVVVDVRAGLHSGEDEALVGLVRLLDELSEAEAADRFDLVAKDWIVVKVLLVCDFAIFLLFQIFDEEKLDCGLGLVEQLLDGLGLDQLGWNGLLLLQLALLLNLENWYFVGDQASSFRVHDFRFLIIFLVRITLQFQLFLEYSWIQVDLWELAYVLLLLQPCRMVNIHEHLPRVGGRYQSGVLLVAVPVGRRDKGRHFQLRLLQTLDLHLVGRHLRLHIIY